MSRVTGPQISELFMGHREGLAGTALTWEVSEEQGEGLQLSGHEPLSSFVCSLAGAGESEASEMLSVDSHHAASR